MFKWLPDVANEIRGELLEFYWMFLVIFTLIVIIFEFFKISERKLNPNDIIKRVVISIILLWSFDEVINLIGMITDGVVTKIGGITDLQTLLGELKNSFNQDAPGLLKFRQMLIYALNITCYIIALLGYYVTDVLIHFVYTVLYVMSPLMILAFVSSSTSYITQNLYKGLMHVSVWKILWSILGVLLLKLATVPQNGGWDTFFMQALLNLCIGVSMLMIPFFAKSLLGDGLSSAASGLAAVSTVPVAKAMSRLPSKTVKGGAKELFSGFKGTRNFTGRRVKNVQNGIERSKRTYQATKSGLSKGSQVTRENWKKFRNMGEIKPPQNYRDLYKVDKGNRSNKSPRGR